MALEENVVGGVHVGLPPGRFVSPGFAIRELRLRNLRRVGWTNGALPQSGIQERQVFLADIAIAGERRAKLLGGALMRANIPILFAVDSGNRLWSCTTRALYALPLGPNPLPLGVTPKTGLECLDRGGTPVIEAGTNWYVCRVPASAWNTCSPNPTLNGLPGWVCLHPPVAPENVSCVY